MTVEELRNLDLRTIRNADRPELVAIVRTAGHQLNKRLANIEAKRLTPFSPAYRGLAAAMGGMHNLRFREGGKSKEELFHMIVEMKNFANAATATVKGARKYEKDVRAAFTQANGTEDSEAYHRMIKDYWEMFTELRRSFPSVDSDQIREDFRKMFTRGYTMEQMIQHEQELYERRMRRAYEEEEEVNGEFTDSPFFTV